MSNTGHGNTGHGNTGIYNTGYRNTGNWNTGNWNAGDCNTGSFNTIEPTISLFNKPSPWTYLDWKGSEAKRLLNRIPKNSVWVESDDMTDEEKAQHPTHETTGGYLKVLDESERTAAAINWWDGLKDEEKAIIMDIPNFDKSIFKEITGMDVDATPPRVTTSTKGEQQGGLNERTGFSHAEQ